MTQTIQALEDPLIVPTEPAQEASNPALPEIKDNPKIGVLWYVVYTLKMTAILYVTKALYELNPSIQVLQITTLKALISILFLGLILNRKLKHVMYDSIDPESKWALAFRSTQSTISIFISYNAMKYFSVSTIGVVCSLTPLVACILAAIMLKERLTLWTIAAVLIVLSCVMMIIFGAAGAEAEAMESNTFALIALCAQPFLLAGGMIASRKMKKNHPMALTCYVNLILAVVSIIGAQSLPGVGLQIVKELGAGSWVLISLAGILTIFENTAKFMAFRYEEAAKLQKLAFLPNVWNFIIDLIKHTTFGALQLSGFILLFVFYTFELIRFFYYESRVEEKESVKDDFVAPQLLDEESDRKEKITMINSYPSEAKSYDDTSDSLAKNLSRQIKA